MSAYAWNPSDVNANFSLSESNVRATTTAGGWVGGRTVISMEDAASSVGRYAEFECVSLTNYCMVGFASRTATLDSGIYSDSGSSLHYSIGQKYPGGSSFGSSWTTGDRVMLAVRNGKSYFGKNGTWFNSADFTAETGFAASGYSGRKYLAMAAHACSIRVFPAVADQTYSAPTGFFGFLAPVTLTRTLLGADLNPLASQTFDWAFFEQNTADTLIAPVATSTATTNGSGVITINVPHTSLVSGQVGSLLISNTAGGATTQCRSHYAPIEIP